MARSGSASVGDLVILNPWIYGEELFGIVIHWTRKHQYQVKILMSTGETEWEYIKDLKVISESR